MNTFYVYVYLDPRKKGAFTYNNYYFENEPFYVGKGKDNRSQIHLRNKILVEDLNRLKANKILKIQKELNIDPIIFKYQENLTEDEAFLLEKDLIQKIGRINLKTGPLTNLTEGGEGNIGLVVTEETRQKQSQFRKGKPTWNKGLCKKTNIILQQTSIKISLARKGCKAWNKGLTKSDPRVKKYCDNRHPIYTNEIKAKMSQKRKEYCLNHPNCLKGVNNPAWKNINKEEFISFYNSGMPYKQIEEKLNISHNWIAKKRREYQLTPRVKII